jgi:RecG-like helicase
MKKMNNYDYLLSDITKLNGVGKKTMEILKKKKINNIFDLLWRLPKSYTDRSLTSKINEIQDNSNVGALFYDRKGKVQIRCNGNAVINNMDQYCKERWNKMSAQSQECYYQNISPGENIEYPEIVKNKLENKLSENFTVVTINISKIDWLYLSSTGHTRVKFLKNNGFTGQWIAP